MSEITRSPKSVAVARACLLGAAVLLLGATPALAVSFGSAQTLQGGLGNPTAIALGTEDPNPSSTADGCVYVLQQNGTAQRICFDETKAVTSTSSFSVPGPLNYALGITVDPDPPAGSDVVVYIATGATSGPFNGRVAKVVLTNAGAVVSVDEDYIRGLGSSSFNHQTNGLDFGPDGCLYIANGNNSDAGYDSDHAASHFSGAILRACVNAPSFDGDCGDGQTQDVSGCDVEVYASGLRNPYDLVWHPDGSLYNTDNDANPGFRENCSPGAPANTFGCTCQTSAPNPGGDEINLIEQGQYYGSPNPYLANPAGLQCQGGNGGDACTVATEVADCGTGTCQDLSSLCTEAFCDDDVQCLYFGGGSPTPTPAQDPNDLYRAPIWQGGGNLDGMDVYAGSFCSDWDSNLLITGSPGAIRRFDLTGPTDEGGVGLSGLGVAVGADGTIYAANYGSGSVDYIVPVDDASFDPCAVGDSCVGGSCLPASCSLPGDCDDSNVCTDDDCVASACSNTNVVDGTPCDDADAGTINDACTSGTCVGVTADGDNDGLNGGNDPCPSDPLNRCYGPVATDTTAAQEIRINCGVPDGSCGGDRVDCNGDTWHSDFGNSTASSNTTSSTGVIVGIDSVLGCTLNAATDDSLQVFQCERWDAGALPELQYSFAVPDGNYLVNLLFANTFSGSAAPGARLFDISIEGALVYEEFDQVVAAQDNPTGNPSGDLTAVSRSALVTVSDGNGLQIDFGHGSIENPTVKGIEVLAQGTCLTAGDCQAADPPCEAGEDCSGGVCVSLPDAAVGTPCSDGDLCTTGDDCDGSGDCTGSPVTCPVGQVCDPGTGACVVSDGFCVNPPVGDVDCDNLDDATNDPCVGAPGVINTLNRCAATADAICGTSPPGTQDCESGTLLRLDIGTSVAVAPASSNTICNGEAWLSETPGTGSTFAGNVSPHLNGVTGLFGCTDPATQSLVLSERWFAGNLTRAYPVANGEYVVNLMFAEASTGQCGPALRIFDMEVEGAPLVGFDQYASALDENGVACGSPVIRSFRVTVSDNVLDVVLSQGAVNNPALKALEARLIPPTGCGSDPECDDGAFCNGAETCNLTTNLCEAGTPPDCSDGVICTVDSCNETTDQCESAPNDANCDNGEFCDGAETCDATLGCLVGGDPCPGPQTCDETNDVCVAPPPGFCTNPPTGDADCDGLNDATVDPCVGVPGLVNTLNRCAGPSATCGAPGGNCVDGSVLRIDNGSTAPTTSCSPAADPWIAETGAGLGSNFGGNVAAHTAGVNGLFGCAAQDLATEAMILSERFGNPLTRSYPVAPGNYLVNLIFAEAFSGVCGNIGARTCDIEINGTQVYGGGGVGDGLDPYATALSENGEGCGSPVVRSAVLAGVSSVDITLIEDNPAVGDGNCALKAVEVIDLGCLINADCDDGDFCNGAEICDTGSGTCQAGTPEPDGASCDDADVCNGSETCQSGACTSGTALVCDDSNPCTTDSCNASTGCQSVAVPAGGACEVDGDLCTVEECNAGGSCLVVGPVDCSDGDICTTDVCDPGSGVCSNPPNDTDNDGLADVDPSCDDPCPSEPLNECYGPAAIDVATGKDVRLNSNLSAAACSGERLDCRGKKWLSDYGFNTGNTFDTGSPIAGLDSLFGCANGPTEDVLQCERWDPPVAPELLYSFDLPDGTYLVNLLFANTFSGSNQPGDRLFDISVEGNLAYDDFDQVVAAQANPTGNPGGDLTAVSRAAVVTVSDGNGLQIEFLHTGVDNPAVKAVEVLCEQALASTWYEDLDADSFGNPDVSREACTQPPGFVADNTDCNDGDETINTNAQELCDGLDNDCDDTVDNAPTDAGGTCSAGVGECAADGVEVCNAGALECDAVIGMPSAELCDGLDNDCNGLADFPGELSDADADGLVACADNCPEISNTDQANADGDGFGDVCDCAPLDPLNAPPVEVGNSVLVNRSGTDAVISWQDDGVSGPFRLYQGFRQGSVLFEYNHVCLGGEILGTQTSDPRVPIIGRVFYYLVTRDICGESGLGADSAGAPRPNDDPCLSINTDTDGDGLIDLKDNCPQVSNAGQEDADFDGFGDVCDNCPIDSNPAQGNIDGDLLGDVCDPDRDGDGVLDDGDGNGTPGDNPCPDLVTTACDDNCPGDYNEIQEDTDGDGLGDACDPTP